MRKPGVTGLFEVLEGLTSASGQVLILGRLVVRGNAATAAGILAHERLSWCGFALSLVAVLFHIGWTLLYVFVRLNAYSFDVYLVFFGAWCTLNGYLIFRSTFLPRILGILLAIDGVGWMLYVSPSFAVTVFAFIAAASGLAEIPLQFRLLVFGVNDRRGRERAAGVPEARHATATA